MTKIISVVIFSILLIGIASATVYQSPGYQAPMPVNEEVSTPIPNPEDIFTSPSPDGTLTAEEFSISKTEIKMIGFLIGLTILVLGGVSFTYLKRKKNKIKRNEKERRAIKLIHKPKEINKVKEETKTNEEDEETKKEETEEEESEEDKELREFLKDFEVYRDTK